MLNAPALKSLRKFSWKLHWKAVRWPTSIHVTKSSVEKLKNLEFWGKNKLYQQVRFPEWLIFSPYAFHKTGEAYTV